MKLSDILASFDSTLPGMRQAQRAAEAAFAAASVGRLADLTAGAASVNQFAGLIAWHDKLEALRAATMPDPSILDAISSFGAPSLNPGVLDAISSFDRAGALCDPSVLGAFDSLGGGSVCPPASPRSPTHSRRPPSSAAFSDSCRWPAKRAKSRARSSRCSRR